MVEEPQVKVPRKKVPSWVLPLVLLVIGILVFWVLPNQGPARPIQFQFEGSTPSKDSD
ncbi:MAG: hypothetical protein J0L72_06225 [Armatimonadetes bacterium]|nr:hypothetical protein [Armatimonadota bacterium]